MLKQLSLIVLICLTGCSVAKLKAPQLQVVGVEVVHADMLKQQLRVRMRVDNPNDRKIPVNGITYQMQLAGEAFADGESQKNFEVPALGSMEFDVNVNANMAGVLLRLMTSGKKIDTLDYRLIGKVSLASGLLRTIPFDQKGIINLR
jgi:LEA14-like dessication related protein